MFARLRGVVALLLLAGSAGAAQRPAEHVVLVTIDGLRAQELFAGADSTIAFNRKASGISDSAAFQRSWWRESAAARRRAVLPFFWDSLVPRGIVIGAPGTAPVISSNGLKFSAPGYAEIYTGQPQVDVTSNANRRYDHRTIFDVVRDRLATQRTDVAAFVSWDVQGSLVSPRPDAVVVSAAVEPLPPESQVGPGLVLGAIQGWIHNEDGPSVRFDAITHVLAVDYLTRYHPRLLHIGLGETDIEAHARRYDRLFDILHDTDAMLRMLWDSIQADPELRDRTAIIITTDHGRGPTIEDWTDHGRGVPDADHIWIAAMGAGIAAVGEVTDLGATQSQVGSTVLALLGLSPLELGPDAAPPLQRFLRRH